MTNLEKYVKAFSEALEVPESDVPALKYGESDQESFPFISRYSKTITSAFFSDA